MRSSTGRWVSGDDFFDREAELKVLETLARDRNHVLLTGQRRMGKTSIVRELGYRLESDGWIFLFVDVEGASCAEDVIADIARAVHPVRPIASRFALDMKRWLHDNIEEISALDFGVKIRAGSTAEAGGTTAKSCLESARHRNSRFCSSSMSCRSSSSACFIETAVSRRSTNS